MFHPPIGARVRVFPTSPAAPVQRAEGIYGQFVPATGSEVLWDSFLQRRLDEGALRWEPLDPPPQPVSPEQDAAPLDAPLQPASPEPDAAPLDPNQGVASGNPA